MKIKWTLDPLKIIQFCIIIILGFYGYSQWSNYLDEKNHTKELKEQYKNADKIIKQQTILLKQKEAILENLKIEISKWEVKHKAIKMPVSFNDALSSLGIGGNQQP